MAKTKLKKAYCPLILRANRLMEAFTKSDDERDFYLDRVEGFIVYVDLNRSQEELDALALDLLRDSSERLVAIPKLSFYETKKIMEGFVNDKVYDIDTKEKLLDIIQGKEARELFLEFIYDHHSELEKWQQFYQERSRVRIIEWLRNESFHFVFEEDLDLNTSIIESVKETLFQVKVSKEIASARKTLEAKAKTYYSNEALNPRPKRGRPPKQTQKVEVEKPVSEDIYATVPSTLQPFLFTPDITSASQVTFSAKYDNEEELIASLRSQQRGGLDPRIESLNRKLETLRQMSSRSFAPAMEPVEEDAAAKPKAPAAPKVAAKPAKKKASPAKKKTATKAKPKAKKATAAKTTSTSKKKPLRRLKPRRTKRSSS